MIIRNYKDLDIQADPAKMVKLNQFETDQMFVDYYFLEPGQSQRVHTHDDSDKVYYLLEGSGRFTIGTDEHDLVAGEGCVAVATVPHGVRNESTERLVLLVMNHKTM
jgi:quercetin dioxygenase-like cupin family protein